MRKKLLAAFVAGGLILGFPAATEAAGAVGASLSGSLQKAEMSGVQRIGGNIIILTPIPACEKEGSSAFREKRIILPAAGMR